MKRNSNGIDGEQLVARAREYGFATPHGLNWESRGIDNDPLRPYLSLALPTGLSDRPGAEPAAPSLNEDAVLTLRDPIASTIRPRTNGPRAAANPRTAPPG